MLAGPARAGKSEALRRLAAALAALENVEVSLVLAGVRPEEIAEWREGPVEPASALSFAASADAQAQAVEQAVEQGRRVAARGADAVVLIDTLEQLPPQAARRALAAARNIKDGGSLTVIATAPAPLGGETTVVALDAALAALGRFPALDLAGSGVCARSCWSARRAPRRSPRRGSSSCRASGTSTALGGEVAEAGGAVSLIARTVCGGESSPYTDASPPKSDARAGQLPRLPSPAQLTFVSGARVRHALPVRLGRELDRLLVALGLDVAEGVGGVVEDDVQLALLDALVEPGGAEDEPAQPVHERAVGGADQLRPAVVDVLAERATRGPGSRR